MSRSTMSSRKGDEVEHIGVFQHLLRQLALLRRQRGGKIVDLAGKRLPLIKATFNLMDEDVF